MTKKAEITEEVNEDEEEVVLKPKQPKRPAMSPERIASRQRAHDIKVIKFLAGGEF